MHLGIRVRAALIFLALLVAGGLFGASPAKGTPLRRSQDPAPRVGFTRLPPGTTGITFAHAIPTNRSNTNQMLLDGAGVGLADVDGDGRPDVFLGAANDGSQLWRNLGDWRFEDITSRAFPDRAVDLAGDVTGVAFADINGDQSPDLVLNSHADGLRIFLNDGHGRFRRQSFPQATARGGHSVALADVDGDGWVDLYVCNYRQRALMDMPSARATFRNVQGVQTVATLDGRPTTDPDLTNRFVVGPTGGIEELGEPDVLYRNLGGTNFVEVPWTGGSFLDEDGRPLSAVPRDWGLSAQFCDVNDDGRPDLYVCNDFQTPDRFWINESRPGQVRLRWVPRSTLRHTSLFSMGVDFADVNRDGRWDFAVLDMLSPDHVRRLTSLDGTPSAPVNGLDPLSRPQSDANTFFLQRPDGSFAEVAHFAGLMATDWAWTPAFLDVDLDGWPDLLVTAGQERGSRDLDVADHMKNFRRGGLRTDAQIFRERQKFPRLAAPLKAFRNRGVARDQDVPTFEDRSAAWGFDFEGVSHGLALADLDGDGDLDVVVNHLNAPAGLYRNDATASRVIVHLKGRSPNTSAVGATLRFRWRPVAGGDGTSTWPQSAQRVVGGRYLSSDGLEKAFACPGEGQGVLEIRWPSGRWTTHEALQADHRYDFEEPEGLSTAATPAPAVAPGGRLSFAATPLPTTFPAPTSDEATLQPLLPRRSIVRTPALALTGGAGATQTLWIGGADQAVQRMELSPAGLGSLSPVGTVRSVLALASLGADVVVASEAKGGAGSATLARIPAGSGVEQVLPTGVRRISVLASSRDQAPGGPWLFVGGAALPGDYPLSADSEVFRADAGGLRSVGRTNLGLVTGSVFADLDGLPGEELVTVSEWGAPRLFHCRGPGVEGWDIPVKVGTVTVPGLGVLSGWWQSVAAGDFDGDGHLDLVLGNWGLNSAYALQSGRPSPDDLRIRGLHLFHGLMDPGPRTCIEGYTASDGRVLPIHGRSELAGHLSWVGGLFPTHRSFALATLEQVLGEHAAKASRLECRWLSSLLLLRRGDHFEARALPDLAQLGPAIALQVADFDGDGHLDLYVAQGFFGHHFGVTRDDAGEGCFLLGRGDGDFDARTPGEAGFRLLGEQRSVVVVPVGGGRRPDLVVGEQGGTVTFLRNRGR